MTAKPSASEHTGGESGLGIEEKACEDPASSLHLGPQARAPPQGPQKEALSPMGGWTPQGEHRSPMPLEFPDLRGTEEGLLKLELTGQNKRLLHREEQPHLGLCGCLSLTTPFIQCPLHDPRLAPRSLLTVLPACQRPLPRLTGLAL